jgi:Uma2 family endonuclease
MQENLPTEDLNAEHIIEEWIDGTLLVSPRPTGKHAYAGSSIGGLLWGPFQRGIDGPGGWWILHEPQVLVRRNKLIPDLAGWRKERMPKLPVGYLFEVVPDWVCEIVSDSSRKMDRVTKPQLYLQAGVKHLWIVDPDIKTLEVFRASPDGWILISASKDDERLRAEPFAETNLELACLWAEVE